MQWTEKVPGCIPKGENMICLSSVFMKHHYCVGSTEAPRWETTRDKDSIVCGFSVTPRDRIDKWQTERRAAMTTRCVPAADGVV